MQQFVQGVQIASNFQESSPVALQACLNPPLLPCPSCRFLSPHLQLLPLSLQLHSKLLQGGSAAEEDLFYLVRLNFSEAVP